MTTATFTTNGTFNRSNIFKAAWVLVKTTAINISNALKTVWSLAKLELLTPDGALATSEATEEGYDYEYDCSSDKPSKPATYKQYEYLKELGADLPLVSRFTKRVCIRIASEAIDMIKMGYTVSIYA